jgi:hypothetical protein
MSEESTRLRQTLTELHDQLESADAIEPELRAPLRSVMEDILALLDTPDSEEAHAERHRSIVGRLSEMALRFETSHPTVAGTLNQLTHMLSNMGI